MHVDWVLSMQLVSPHVKSAQLVNTRRPIIPCAWSVLWEHFSIAVAESVVVDDCDSGGRVQQQKFCGEQEDPADSTDYLVPQITTTVSAGSLFDYFGVPTGVNLSLRL